MLYLRFSLINDSFWFFLPGPCRGPYRRGTAGDAAQVSIEGYGGLGHGGVKRFVMKGVMGGAMWVMGMGGGF